MISNKGEREATATRSNDDSGIEDVNETRDDGAQVISMPEINSTIPVDVSARFLKMLRCN
jgi:hypothetical protein